MVNITRITPFSYDQVFGGRANMTANDEGVGGGIAFCGKWTTGTGCAVFGGIQGVKANGTEGDRDGRLEFLTCYEGGSPSARMVIDPVGNVGIGFLLTSPSSKLVVKGTGTTGASSSLDVTDSNGTSTLFVRDDGNVGIGTTSPDEKLEVNGGVKIGDTSNTNAGTLRFNSGVLQVYQSGGWKTITVS
jgi:hypothetical protein